MGVGCAGSLLCALFPGRRVLRAGRCAGESRPVAVYGPGSPIPAELLAAAGFGALTASLRGAQNAAPTGNPRDGIYQTARARRNASMTRTSWHGSRRRAAEHLPAFGLAEFASGRDTLYLLTESRSAASPLIAARDDRHGDACRAAAGPRNGGRLDPPMVVVLDETYNICRIADLPELYSHLGSRGIVPVTILQSYEQGVTVWGENGMAALWGAATKKIIGAGVDSPRLARDLATLVGQHDVPVISVSYGDGRASQQVSLRRQDILEPAAIRALPPGSALLLATGTRPALISLRPWSSGPQAPQITAARGRARAACSAPPRTTTPKRGRRRCLPGTERRSRHDHPARHRAIGRR